LFFFLKKKKKKKKKIKNNKIKKIKKIYKKNNIKNSIVYLLIFSNNKKTWLNIKSTRYSNGIGLHNKGLLRYKIMISMGCAIALLAMSYG